MEGDLIGKLVTLGPWGVAAALLVLLRKELLAVFMAPKEDRAVEGLLKTMNEQFKLNMDMFKVTNGMLEDILKELERANERQEKMLLETVRGHK